MTAPDPDGYRHRLKAIEVEREAFPIEARKLLEAAWDILDNGASVAANTDADPHDVRRVADLAAEIRGLLDRRQLVKAETWELALELRQAGLLNL